MDAGWAMGIGFILTYDEGPEYSPRRRGGDTEKNWGKFQERHF
jgi:hypothetical protein